MKRILFILLATLSTAVCSAGTNAMSNSKVRKETRFLTDKMAYELNNTMMYMKSIMTSFPVYAM